jgi:integrase
MKTYPRSLPVQEWPEADREAWDHACRPGFRFVPGGAASRLAQVSRDDYANRYGAFLGFLQRTGRLKAQAAAGALVDRPNVAAYLADLKARVTTVTVYNAISKLRRAASLIAPSLELSWLKEIEEDLRIVAVPRSKFDRFVMTDRLVEAGLTLIIEANSSAASAHARAMAVRNGLMIAILALCPIRLKNFAALEIGRTLQEIEGSWWIVLPAQSTKSRRADERRLPDFMKPYIGDYLSQSRPVLLRSNAPTNAVWISSTTGAAMTKKPIGMLVSQITNRTLGVDVSPHRFRTAAASTAATDGGSDPHLASALLNHTDPRVTEEHYNRASSMSAAQTYADIVRQLQGSRPVETLGSGRRWRGSHRRTCC